MAGSNSPDVYLIHPVMDLTEEEKIFLDQYVDEIEKTGLRVHYPIRDVEQDDQTGAVSILEQHREAMLNCREIHIYWKSKSRGSVFDFGMAFLTKKPLVLVNRKGVESGVPPRQKSFEKVLLKICQDSKLGI